MVRNIDLNRATADEISDAGIAQMDPELAEALVEYRDEHGPFESWDEVASVPGFNEQLVAILQEEGAQLGGLDEEMDAE